MRSASEEILLTKQLLIRVWKGIIGIRDVIKMGRGIRENAKYLEWKRDSSKFGAGCGIV